jgi:5-methylcytosine-specific restriction endonuclease McrA
MRKAVPKALRQQVWLKYNGPTFNCKCQISWCENIITPFSFEVGHNIPHSKGGPATIDNLRPLCSSCNKSMGNNYTIDEFSNYGKHNNKSIKKRKFNIFTRCFGRIAK